MIGVPLRVCWDSVCQIGNASATQPQDFTAGVVVTRAPHFSSTSLSVQRLFSVFAFEAEKYFFVRVFDVDAMKTISATEKC